jgi:hypothetical protein
MSRDVNQWDETGDCEANRVEPAEAGTCGTSALTFVARGRRSDEIGGSREPERWTVRWTWRSSRPSVAVGSSPSRPSRTLRRAREQWLPTIPCHRVLLVRTALVCSGERGAGTALRHHLRHVTCIRNHLGSLSVDLPPRVNSRRDRSLGCDIGLERLPGQTRDTFRPRGFTPPRRFAPRTAPERVRGGSDFGSDKVAGVLQPATDWGSARFGGG